MVFCGPTGVCMLPLARQFGCISAARTLRLYMWRQWGYFSSDLVA